MNKYTHIPDSVEAGSPVNRYIFVFRKAILVSPQLDLLAEEQDIVTKLIYGETRNHLLSEKYLPTIQDILRLGGLELQVIGDYDPKKYPVFLQ